MKKLHFLALIISILISTQVFGDSDSCIKYEIEITLQNDSIIKGFYLLSGQYVAGEFSKPLDSISFNDIYVRKLNSNYDKGPIIVYNKLKRIRLKGNEEFMPFFCIKSDRLEIPLENIKTVKELGRTFCYHENDNQSYIGLGIQAIVTELTSEEIEKLEQFTPVIYFPFYETCFDNDLQYLMVISYNDKLMEQELKSIILEKCCINYSVNSNIYQREKDYLKAKDELLKNDIVVFRLSMGN